jgi:hypothetical protein
MNGRRFLLVGFLVKAEGEEIEQPCTGKKGAKVVVLHKLVKVSILYTIIKRRKGPNDQFLLVDAFMERVLVSIHHIQHWLVVP